MKVSHHFFHSHIYQHGKYNIKFMNVVYVIFLSFITYAPCYNAIMKGTKFEILPECLNLSRMADYNLNSFFILMAASNKPTTRLKFLWSIFPVLVQSTG